MKNLKQEKEEEVNYLASVSDLVTALFFILLLSICFCVIKLNESTVSFQTINELKQKIEEITKELNSEQTEKLQILSKLKSTTTELEKSKIFLDIQREQNENIQRELRLAQKEVGKFKEESEELGQMKAQLAAITQKIAGANIARTNLLEDLGNKLKQEGIEVQLDPATGVLRLPENAITFETGSSELRQKYKERLRILGQALSMELPCYDASQWNVSRCEETNPLAYTLDAVFVEGHTDNQPFGGDTTGTRNRSLSTERANTVFSELRKDNPSLFELKNPRGQQLFSLSGYGEERPLEGHKHIQPKSDEANRRIEIRFLMTTPELSESEYEQLKEKIDAADSI